MTPTRSGLLRAALPRAARLRLGALALGLLLADATATAQTVVLKQGDGERTAEPFVPCTLPGHDGGLHGTHDGARDETTPEAATAAPVGAPLATVHVVTTRFEVTYVGFPDEARAAFQRAVDAWAAHLGSGLPIRIEARWESLRSDILGSAGPYLFRNFSGAPRSGTWYPAALADRYAGRDLDASIPDIDARFNSSFTRWHFGEGPPAGNDYDLATVVLHELAHGLGFIGSYTVENGAGSYGLDNTVGVPFVFDHFVDDAQGRSLLDRTTYPVPSLALAQALQSDALVFDGAAVRSVYGQPAPLYAPPTWNEGSSLSHFDEGAFPRGTSYALMTPFIASGEVVELPDDLACAVLADIGWTLDGGCADLAPPPLPPGGEVFAVAFAPGAANPSRGRTTLELTASATQSVQVLLFDVAGRLAWCGPSTTVTGGLPAVLDVGAEGLPSGVYFARIVGEGQAETVPLTVIR